MIEDGKEIFIDPDIPVEQQISFLRKNVIGAKIDTYLVLKEKLGAAGIELFKEILRAGYAKIAEITKDLDFQTIASFAGYSDHILGLKSAKDYMREDEFQYSISYCPYLEESRHRGLDSEFCHIFESIYNDMTNKSIGEITEPARMCDGDSMCIFRVKNTLAK